MGVLAAGCATSENPPPPPPCASLPPSSGPPLGVTLSTGDTGRTYCLPLNQQVTVILQGSSDDRWEQIVDSNTDTLSPTVSGALTLPAGATGAAYIGLMPGTATLSSRRASCAAPSCDSSLRWSVTLVVKP